MPNTAKNFQSKGPHYHVLTARTKAVTAFVRHCIGTKVPLQQIERELKQCGWVYDATFEKDKLCFRVVREAAFCVLWIPKE